MNTGKREAQSFEEMTTSMTAKKEKNLSSKRASNCYKEAAGEYKEEKLKDLIVSETAKLVDFTTKEKISLEDIDELKARSIIYLRACEETGTFPSSIGLAHALGYSDRALRDWRNNKPQTETAQWLEIFNELCADILNQSALNNNANPTFAIFIDKALYGYVDKTELLLTPNTTPPSEEVVYSAEEIRERYLPHNGNKDEGGC